MFHYLNYRIVWIKSDLLYKLLAADILREKNRAVDPDSGEKILRKKTLKNARKFVIIDILLQFVQQIWTSSLVFILLGNFICLFHYHKTLHKVCFTQLFKLDPDPHWGKQLDPDPQKMISIAAETITSSFLWRYESGVWVVSRENFLYMYLIALV